ncbi:SGNH/GDSL hydrolase family protein [Enterococcus sp. CSURQ0835]|uniref:SGNH/GDSL hydrolase family protein n=1 Tax=Enterococcus sp. CSURQ0835 TaxID=2681394 RepID=UPI001358922E|nr:SGNH/GDSL hydrolase family protein [Enterococcus sp. CSURQ0835]
MKLKKLWWLAVPLVVTVVTLVGLNFAFPAAKPQLQSPKNDPTRNYKETVHYVAVGDSLTQGVGDETKRGGFVPLVANYLKDHYQLKTIQTENFGISGERSDQILKRVKKDDELQRSLKSSDLITITVGGNDLLQAFQKNLTASSAKKFARPIKTYTEHTEDLLTAVRKLNKTAPIYVVGIYNPYYLNFPDVKEMQKVVDSWNDATKKLTQDVYQCYFIPVNDLLYKGLPEKTAKSADTQQSTTDSSVKNNVLYDKDNFHPNNLGYQIMAHALEEKMIATKAQWLVKE